jgi:hypothetical protein
VGAFGVIALECDGPHRAGAVGGRITLRLGRRRLLVGRDGPKARTVIGIGQAPVLKVASDLSSVCFVLSLS